MTHSRRGRIVRWWGSGGPDRTLNRLSPKHRFAIALPEAHALAGQKSIELAALRSEDWVSLDDVFFPGRREFLLATCAQAGFEPSISAEVDSVAMMLAAVASSDAVALVPRHSEKLPHAGCVFVRLAPPVPIVELVLVTRRREPMPELDALHELLRQRARELADG